MNMWLRRTQSKEGFYEEWVPEAQAWVVLLRESS